MFCARCKNKNERFETKLTSQLRQREAKRGFFTLVAGVSKWTFPDAKKKRPLPYRDKKNSFSLWQHDYTDEILMDPEIIPEDVRSQINRLFSLKETKNDSTSDEIEDPNEGKSEEGEDEEKTKNDQDEKQEDENEEERESLDSILMSDAVELEDSITFTEENSEEITEYDYESDSEDDLDTLVTPFGKYLKTVEGKSRTSYRSISKVDKDITKPNGHSDICSVDDEDTLVETNPSVDKDISSISSNANNEGRSSSNESKNTNKSSSIPSEKNSTKSGSSGKKTGNKSAEKSKTVKKRTAKQLKSSKIKPKHKKSSKTIFTPTPNKSESRKKSDAQNITEKLKTCVVFHLFRDYSKNVFRKKCPKFRIFPELE